MKALVGAFNQEKALVGPGEGPSRGLLRDCTTSPINRFAALVIVHYCECFENDVKTLKLSNCTPPPEYVPGLVESEEHVQLGVDIVGAVGEVGPRPVRHHAPPLELRTLGRHRTLREPGYKILFL